MSEFSFLAVYINARQCRRKKLNGPEQTSDYLSPDEIMVLLESLSAADRAKILLGSKQYVYGTGLELDDLLGMAIEQALEGKRRIPKKGTIVTSLIMDIKSIACNQRRKRNREDVLDPDEFHDGTNADMVKSVPSAEEITSESQQLRAVLSALESEFLDDPKARAVLKGKMEGYSQNETIALEPMIDTEFDAARKRVTRFIVGLKCLRT